MLDKYPDDLTGITAASSVLACLAAVALAVFIHFEHRHAVEPSPLPGLYIFVTLLLDIAKTRSHFLRNATSLDSLGCVTALVSALKLVLLCLGELPRRYRAKTPSLGPKTIHGFWGRTFLVWLNSTLLIGLRNILSIDDIPHLGPTFASARLAAIFEPVWVERKAAGICPPSLTYQLILCRQSVIIQASSSNILLVTLVFLCCSARPGGLHGLLFYRAVPFATNSTTSCAEHQGYKGRKQTHWCHCAGTARHSGKRAQEVWQLGFDN